MLPCIVVELLFERRKKERKKKKKKKKKKKNDLFTYREVTGEIVRFVVVKRHGAKF